MMFWQLYSTHNKPYRKHRRISRTFLLKISISNWGCGLSARTSRHHAKNLHKVTSFSENSTVCKNLCIELIRTSYYMTWVCSRSNACSDWLIVGHYSPVMPSKEPYNKQLINLERSVSTGKSQTSALPYWPRYRSVNAARSRSEIFP